MAEDLPPPIRLMNFVSQEELAEAKRTRGERVDDGTAQRDRPLYEILKENKDKQDAEFNERFKHRPPKALDEDETEFLDKLEMSRMEYERQIADEETQELQRFQAAVAAQSVIAHEVKERTVSDIQEKRTVEKKNQPQTLGMIIKVKPQAKRAKVDPSPSKAMEKLEEKSSSLVTVRTPTAKGEPPDQLKNSDSNGENVHVMATTALVSYSDESDGD